MWFNQIKHTLKLEVKKSIRKVKKNNYENYFDYAYNKSKGYKQKTKKINNQRAKRLQERIIRDRFRDSKQPAKRGIRYSIKSFGEGMEKIMANHDDFSGVFCVNINSDNPKFKRVDHDNDQMGYFLAELTIRELLRYQNPLVEKDEIDQAISDFHQSYLDQA